MRRRTRSLRSRLLSLRVKSGDARHLCSIIFFVRRFSFNHSEDRLAIRIVRMPVGCSYGLLASGPRAKIRSSRRGVGVPGSTLPGTSRLRSCPALASPLPIRAADSGISTIRNSEWALLRIYLFLWIANNNVDQAAVGCGRGPPPSKSRPESPHGSLACAG